jgi:hypothetical protein
LLFTSLGNKRVTQPVSRALVRKASIDGETSPGQPQKLYLWAEVLSVALRCLFTCRFVKRFEALPSMIEAFLNAPVLQTK